MTQIIVTRKINAPIELVFNTVADIRQFSKALPHIVKYEFLSDTELGIGAQFIETRVMRGRESKTELEVIDYINYERVRMIADSHGTVWDTVFAVLGDDIQTNLKVTLDVKPYKFISKLINPLSAGRTKKFIELDMDAVKIFCENV